MAAETYICVKCGQPKTADEYYYTKGARRKDCILCVLAWQRIYYLNNKDKIQQYQRYYRSLPKSRFSGK